MFNRNGNNNGVPRRTPPVASRNGNGHKPDAAIVTASTTCSGTGCSPAVTQALGQPIDPALVSQRKGRAREVPSTTSKATSSSREANRIFGYGGWGYELVERRNPASVRHRRSPDRRELKTASVYTAPVRVTVRGALCPAPIIGFHAVTDETPDGHDTALEGGGYGRHEACASAASASSFGNGLLRRPVFGECSTQPEQVPVQANGRYRAEPVQPTRSAGSEPALDRIAGTGATTPSWKPCARSSWSCASSRAIDEDAGARRHPEGGGQGHWRPDGRRARVR